MIYHIATEADWARRTDVYAPAGWRDEGFVHCSTDEQVVRVANRLFTGRRDLVLLHIDPGQFVENIRWYMDPVDLLDGLIKSVVFGALVGLIGCHKGFNASGGAKGVGEATTQAVVVGSVTVLVADYFVTALMY